MRAEGGGATGVLLSLCFLTPVGAEVPVYSFQKTQGCPLVGFVGGALVLQSLAVTTVRCSLIRSREKTTKAGTIFFFAI